MYKNFIFVVLMIGLSGCATVRMEKSKEAYKTCLLENQKKPAACAALGLIYEADLKAISRAHIYENESHQDRPKAWMMNQNGKSYLCNNYGGSVTCN